MVGCYWQGLATGQLRTAPFTMEPIPEVVPMQKQGSVAALVTLQLRQTTRHTSTSSTASNAASSLLAHCHADAGKSQCSCPAGSPIGATAGEAQPWLQSTPRCPASQRQVPSAPGGFADRQPPGGKWPLAPTLTELPLSPLEGVVSSFYCVHFLLLCAPCAGCVSLWLNLLQGRPN